MKKFNLVLAMMALVFAFVIATPANEASAVTFTDVTNNGSELYEAISTLSDQGIMSGVSSTKFAPNTLATRGETAQVIVNALGWENETVQNPNFSDVPTSHKYYKAIAILANKQIVNSGGKFNPEGSLKRSQIAKIITLAFELEAADTSNIPFKDLAKSDAATKGYIATLVQAGITQGTTPTTFAPNQEMKRSQLALFIYRGLDQIDSGDFEIIGIE